MNSADNSRFINCIGTYIYRAAANRGIPEEYLLNFLSDKELVWKKSTDNDRENIATDIARYNQPVNIHDTTAPVNYSRWHLAFIKYLEEEFSLQFNNLSLKGYSRDEFTVWLHNNLKTREKSVFILIDDYYNHSNSLHYKTIHDTHWVQVDEYDKETQSYRVTDSNKKGSFDFPCELFYEAFSSDFSRGEVMLLEIPRQQELSEGVFKLPPVTELEFIEIIKGELHRLKEEVDLLDQYLQGFVYSIQNLIIPYLKNLRYRVGDERFSALENSFKKLSLISLIAASTKKVSATEKVIRHLSVIRELLE